MNEMPWKFEIVFSSTEGKQNQSLDEALLAIHKGILTRESNGEILNADVSQILKK